MDRWSCLFFDKGQKDYLYRANYSIKRKAIVPQDFVNSDNYHEDNDYSHYIFEKAIETIFGPEVWVFINSKTK